MPADKIVKIVAGLPSNPGTASDVTDVGVAFDSTSKELKIFDGTTLYSQSISSLASGSFTAAAATNLGAKNGSTVTVVEYGGPWVHQTVLTLTATPITVADATAGGGVKLYTFPEGAITLLGGNYSIIPTTTSVLSSTLHAGVTIDMGVGTASAGAGALTTTEDDIIDSVNGTSSATINVAGATTTAVRTSAPAIVDGHSSAKTANFNIGVATGTDIDADATVTLTGTVTIQWAFSGDV